MITRQAHLLALEYVDTEDEREEELVLLKERSAHVPVDGVGEVVIQVENSLFQLTGRLAVHDRLEIRHHNEWYRTGNDKILTEDKLSQSSLKQIFIASKPCHR